MATDRNRLLIVATLAACLYLTALQNGITAPAKLDEAREVAAEQPVHLIPISGDVARASAQISGLAWYGEHLIILPQYPSPFRPEQDGRIFAVAKESIYAFLDGKSEAAIVPHKIAFVAEGLKARIKGFEGYEAIAFCGHRVFMTIESKTCRGMLSYLVTGEIASDLSLLRLNPDKLTRIPAQTDVPNMADEALVVVEDKVITLYEANGVRVNPRPVAHVFDMSMRPLGTIPFPTIEYRVTDATASDTSGRFWVSNFFFPGDRSRLKPAPDRLVLEYGLGSSHSRHATVERLVEFEYGDAGVLRTDAAPIQLQLAGDLYPRNWEGLVRLDGRGFLLATDKYPSTLLGFVPVQHTRRAVRRPQPSRWPYPFSSPIAAR